MNRVYLIYPQYRHTNETYPSIWLPYSVAAVWCYAEQHDFVRQNFHVEDILYRRDPVDQVLDSMVDPDLCLFSVYTWNHQYNLKLAQAIKNRYPQCTIVFGGPEIPEKAIEPAESFVDVYVHHEGEHNLVQLLQHYLKDQLQPVYNNRTRQDLINMPSPYVDSDLMDRVIHQETVSPRMIMETNRGCPFGCTFCDWGGLTKNKIKTFDLQRVFAEIDWLADNCIEYVYIADANFGALYERDLQIVEYLVQSKKETGYPKKLNVNWYKNARKNIIRLNRILAENGLTHGMTLSVQSLNPDTLSAIDRDNMEITDLCTMYSLLNRKQLPYYTEFIVGLPEETVDSFCENLCSVIDFGCNHRIDAYPFEIMANAPVADQLDRYGIKTFRYATYSDCVTEYSNIVWQTRSMSDDDMVICWTWAWFINTLHYNNITKNCYLKSGITAYSFYSDLYRLFLEDPLLKQPIVNKISQYRAAYQDNLESTSIHYGLDIHCDSSTEYYKQHRDRIEKLTHLLTAVLD